MTIFDAKEYIAQDLFNDIIYVFQNIENFKAFVLSDEKCDCSLFGVFDTKNGEEVYEIYKNFDGELISYRRFMHKESFFKFNNDCKIYYK